MITPHTRELWRERAKSDGDIRDMIGVIERLEAQDAISQAEIARLRFDLASRGGD